MIQYKFPSSTPRLAIGAGWMGGNWMAETSGVGVSELTNRVTIGGVVGVFVSLEPVFSVVVGTG